MAAVAAVRDWLLDLLDPILVRISQAVVDRTVERTRAGVELGTIHHAAPDSVRAHVAAARAYVEHTYSTR